MKKLFLCVATALCSTFAFADEADLVVNPVTITNGVGTMEVVVNKTGTTAFQFDVKLPANVSATAFGLDGAPATRKFEKAHYNANDNTWRFLSYDENNATFDGGTTFNITLAAADGATTSEAETSEILVVDDEGNGTDVDGDNVVVTVENGASITFGNSGKTTYVCDQDLDFSSLTDVKAYIAMGCNVSNANVWLARVKDVPANTPIWVQGPANTTKIIPFGTSKTYYPKTLLVGSATETVNIPAEDADYKCYTLMSDGTLIAQSSGYNGFPAKKAYFCFPKNVTSNVGPSLALQIGEYGNTTLVNGSDLDFTNETSLKAYVVIGFGQGSGLITARVKNVSAETPLYVTGTKNTDYSIPSSKQEFYYVNMLEGKVTGSTALSAPTDEITNYVLREGKWGRLMNSTNNFPGGKAYLPVPTPYTNVATSRGMGNDFTPLVTETEVIVIKLGSISGEDDGTTGIRSIDEGQFTNDVWYNLNGQRIDTPTKKGLYIKNGKKVLVK